MLPLILALGGTCDTSEEDTSDTSGEDTSDTDEPPSELVINLRASFLVMGPLLTRFGRAACCPPGGDAPRSGVPWRA